MLDVGIEPTLVRHLRHTDYKSVGASSYTNPAVHREEISLVEERTSRFRLAGCDTCDHSA